MRGIPESGPQKEISKRPPRRPRPIFAVTTTTPLSPRQDNKVSSSRCRRVQAMSEVQVDVARSSSWADTVRRKYFYASRPRQPQPQGGHFPDHMKFPDFSLTYPGAWTGKDYRYTAQRLNSRCFTLIITSIVTNLLYKSYKSVNDEHIQSPGPQAAKSCKFQLFSSFKVQKANFSFPDFSLTTLEFPDFSRFSSWVATLSTVFRTSDRQFVRL